MSSVHDNVAGAEAFGKSAYFEPGLYDVEIIACKLNEGESTSFIVECRVLSVQSSHPDAPEVGATAAQIMKLGEGHKTKMAMGDWRGFLESVLGDEAPPDKDPRWAKISTKAVETDWFTGIQMKLECFHKKTKAKTDFTVHKWLGQIPAAA